MYLSTLFSEAVLKLHLGALYPERGNLSLLGAKLARPDVFYIQSRGFMGRCLRILPLVHTHFCVFFFFFLSCENLRRKISRHLKCKIFIKFFSAIITEKSESQRFIQVGRNQDL